MNRFLGVLASSALIIMILSSQSIGSSNTAYYLSPNGCDDKGNGTSVSPWRTSSRAMDEIMPGDTLYLMEGIYHERLLISKSGHQGSEIVITSSPGDSVVIDGSGLSANHHWWGLIEIYQQSHVVLDGLIIINSPGQGVLAHESAYILVKNCFTYNTISSGIASTRSNNFICDNNEIVLACNDGSQECLTISQTDTFIVSNNHIHDGGPGNHGGEGIDAKNGSSNGKIYGNRVHDVSRVGIYVDAWNKHTFNISVYSNYVFDGDEGGIALASEYGGLLENITVQNNFVHHCGHMGIAIANWTYLDTKVHPMKNLKVLDNAIYSCGFTGKAGGIRISNTDFSNLLIRNNIISDNIDCQIMIADQVPLGQLIIENNLLHGSCLYNGDFHFGFFLKEPYSF